MSAAAGWPAIRLLAARQLRRSAGPLLLLAILAGATGGLLAGTLAVATRSATAPQRLAAATHLEDVRISSYAGTPDYGVAARRYPEVREAWVAQLSVAALPGPQLAFSSVIAGPPRPGGLFTPVVLAGRMPGDAAPGEIAVIEAAAEHFGMHLGTRLPLRLLTTGQFQNFGATTARPQGPTVAATVVGIVRIADEGHPIAPIIAGAAFLGRRAGITAGNATLLRLRDPGEARTVAARVNAAAARAAPNSHLLAVPATVPRDEQNAALSAARRTVVGGLVALMVIGVLVGVRLVAQAAWRWAESSRGEQRIEAALGLAAGRRALVRLLPAALPAAAAAVMAAVGWRIGSGRLPMGRLRRLDPDTGRFLTGWVLAVAVAVAVGSVLVSVAWSSRRSLTRLSVAGRGRAGWSLRSRFPAIQLGTRALRRGVPAVVWVVVGVAGVSVALATAASLHRLEHTPARYGWVASAGLEDLRASQIQAFARLPQIRDSTPLDSRVGRLDGTSVQLYAARGPLTWQPVAGRVPQRPGEVMLGPRLAGSLDKPVGSRVIRSVGERRETLRVVGIGVGLSVNGERQGANALLTYPDLIAGGEPPQFSEDLVRAAPGVDLDGLARAVGGDIEIDAPAPPTEVENLAQLDPLLALLGGVLGLVALAAVANGIVAGARRRRRESALLRALGMTPRATAGPAFVGLLGTACVGVVVGVPLGLGIARVLWDALARSAGVAPDLLVPWAAVGYLAAGAVVAAVVLAVPTGWWTARVSPGPELRRE